MAYGTHHFLLRFTKLNIFSYMEYHYLSHSYCCFWQ